MHTETPDTGIRFLCTVIHLVELIYIGSRKKLAKRRGRRLNSEFFPVTNPLVIQTNAAQHAPHHFSCRLSRELIMLSLTIKRIRTVFTVDSVGFGMPNSLLFPTLRVRTPTAESLEFKSNAH